VQLFEPVISVMLTDYNTYVTFISGNKAHIKWLQTRKKKIIKI